MQFLGAQNETSARQLDSFQEKFPLGRTGIFEVIASHSPFLSVYRHLSSFLRGTCARMTRTGLL